MKNAAAKVSVVLPLYNRENAVINALQSVLEQSYSNFEVIVVDDCSTDRSAAMVEMIDDKRLQLLRHSENKGAAAARNTGIRAAKGEFIAFQDSDDWWLPEKLALQMQVFTEAGDDVGVVYSAFRRHRDKKAAIIPGEEFAQLPKSGSITESLLLKNFITIQAAVVRSRCFEKAGYFNEQLKRFHDWELWLRISRYFNFAYIDRVLVELYYSEASISAEQEDLIEALRFISEEHYDLYRRAGKDYLSGLYFSYGHNLCLGGYLSAGRKQILKALLISPAKVKSFPALLASLGGSGLYHRLYRCIK